jgi:predicted regulator of Ras-like GTPase activity (Roadblock/LC7/MglB family)
MATATLLPTSLQNCLQEVIERSNLAGSGIRGILLSTTEGVPLGRVFASDQPLNEDILSAIESVWAPASKQFPFLGLEKLHQVTAIYDHGTLVHVYQTPVVITILCTAQNNLGAVRTTAVPLLKQVLEPLCTTLVNSLPDFDNGSLYYQ